MLMTAATMKAKTKNLATKKNNIIAKDKPKNILNGLMMVEIYGETIGQFLDFQVF